MTACRVVFLVACFLSSGREMVATLIGVLGPSVL